MTYETDRWKKLTDNIPPLHNNHGISMGELSVNLGLKKRDLRRAIEDARRHGVLICSTSNGYYMPTTLPQISAYARYMLSRVETSWSSLVPALRAMENWNPDDKKSIQDIQERLLCLHEMIVHEVKNDSGKSE